MSKITVKLIDVMGSDLSVVNAARVSFGKQSNWEMTQDSPYVSLSSRDTRLINYLAKHKHISPFGHCFASFHVKAPIFVARQLVKHKFLRWNEISRRYVDEDPEFYVPDVWRGRSADKKQGSAGVSKWNHGQGTGYREHEYEAMASVLHLYKQMIDVGVAPEQARMVLPQSTMTEFYWSGSLDAFADMCRLRCKEDTQLETREVADQINLEMKALFPVSWEALLKDYGDN